MDMRKFMNIVFEAVGDDDIDAEFNRDLANRQQQEKNTPQTIQQLTQHLSELLAAYRQVQQITRRIKNDDTVSSILSDVSQLASSVDIDVQDFESVESEIFQKARELESAIYGLDEVFKDAVDNVKYRIEELEDEQYNR